MLTIILALNMMMTITFMMMSHPLSMGMILLMQTMIISLLTGNMNSSFWFSYILFLIMVGGMLILFMYMTSIASNEKFSFNPLIILMMLIPTMMIPFIPNKWNYLTNNEMMMFQNYNNLSLSINKFINFPLMMMFIFLMIYLFITLIATVKITNFKQGSIRQMN